MKKNNSPLLLLFIFLMLISGKVISQTLIPTTPQLTPGGYFDKVFDQYGNQYDLADLSLGSHRPVGGTHTVSALPTQSCSSGYFNVYFAPNSYWDNNTQTAQDVRNVLCQVLGDISNFISSPLSGNTKINLYCDDLDAASISNGALASASPFYILPANPSNPNQGITDNVIRQMIISGQDPYTGVVAGTFFQYSTFYHGQIRINPNTSWHLNTASASVSSSDADSYTVFLHEITHALGFVSLINYDGYSKFGHNNNFFSRYDQFLYNGVGFPLLTNTTSTSGSYCNYTNLSFSGSTLAISQGTCSSISNPPTVFSCSNAARYASSNVNVNVYTPVCFMSGSSLSHFADACSAPSSFTPMIMCTTTPPNDNLYFVMSAGNGAGLCYVKRYLKEEERYVLCDLGYSVSNTYNSSAAGASHNYAGSICGGTNVWGMNDGMQNGMYTYTAAAGVNTLSIPISGSGGILSNDASTASQIACVQVLYNNATYAILGNSLKITAGANVTGLVLIKYYPQTSSGAIGNATYIYAYFVPGSCNPPNPCNMTQNGGFESIYTSTVGCGSFGTNLQPGYTQPGVSCWEGYLSCDLFATNCTDHSGFYNLGTLTFPSNTVPVSSYNSAVSSKVVGLAGYFGAYNVNEAVKNTLAAPLIPGQTYQLSLFAYNLSAYLWSLPGTQPTTTFNPSYDPLVITVASVPVNAINVMPNFPAPGLNVLTQFTVTPVNMWTALSNTFVVSPTLSVSHGAIIIGIQTATTAGVPYYYYTFLDDISLQPASSSPTFSIPNSMNCGGTTFTNLAQYASPIPGTFSGTGVTYSGGQYHFNTSNTLTPGVYPVAFTYTSGGCVNNLYQSIVVQPVNSITVSASPQGYCNNLGLGGTSIISATSSTSGSYTCTWQPGNLSGATQTVTISSSIIYTVTAVSNTCTVSQTLGILITPAPTLSLSTSIITNICPSSSLTLISASGSYTALAWQPGGMITNSVIVTPSAYTIYTVTANPLCGGMTTTIGVNPQIVNTLPLNSAYSVLGSTLNGNYNPNPVPNNLAHYILNTDATVNGIATFDYGEILALPNVKITVPPLGKLNLNGIYMHTCGSDMWQGIVVENASELNVNPYTNFSLQSTLIEDAVTAISASYNSTAPPPATIRVQNTIFNKNYTDISLTGYNDPNIIYSAALKVENCVFTCRDFSINPGSADLPQSSTASYPYTPQLFTVDYGLRYASSNDLGGNVAPYLHDFTSAILKAPYTGQTSRRAIFLSNTTFSNNFGSFIIGDAYNSNSFNLFDNHAVFVNAENCNVKLQNNVFQNQWNTSIPPSTLALPSGGAAYAGAIQSAAVMHKTYDGQNHSLDMSAANTGVGNRFWDCYRAVEGFNVFDFKLRNASLRSAQTVSNANQYLPGAVGLNLNSNRVNYYINNNEFTNIKNAINIPLMTGYNAGGGNNLALLAIHQNTFSTGGGFMNQAVNITNPSGVVPTVLSPMPSVGGMNGVWLNGQSYWPIGCVVLSNTINEAWNGVNVSGFTGYPVWIVGNNINLKDNNTAQRGIALTNVSSSTGYANSQRIWLNNVQGQSVSTNTSLSMIYGSLNTGLNSPCITCNSVSRAGTGFEFSGQNNVLNYGGTLWQANSMEDLTYGMLLNNNGVIGAQGNTLTGMGNDWLGAWPPSVNFCIYTNTSVALYSPLWTSQTPSSVDGNPPIYSYPVMGGIYPAVWSADCFAAQAIVVNPHDWDVSDFSAAQLYIQQSQFYHFLRYNDSLRQANGDMQQLYEQFNAQYHLNILAEVEENLYAGDYRRAREMLAGFRPVYGIQEKMEVPFYNLYANYLEAIDKDTKYGGERDQKDLDVIAQLCPAEYGSIVYKARALYNGIYNVVMSYENDCNSGGGESGRFASNMQPETLRLKQADNWNVEMFPNPASDKVIIRSTNEKDDLQISIRDLTGRVVLFKRLKTEQFISSMNLDLINGAYIATITNGQNQVISKKLLIAK